MTERAPVRVILPFEKQGEMGVLQTRNPKNPTSFGEDTQVGSLPPGITIAARNNGVLVFMTCNFVIMGRRRIADTFNTIEEQGLVVKYCG